MRVGTFVEYCGYAGTIEYSCEDQMHYGELINTGSYAIQYRANTIEALRTQFCNAIDNFLVSMQGR